MFGDYNKAIADIQHEGTHEYIVYQVLLRSGVTHPTVSKVRARLAALGDLASADSSNLYDKATVDAVIRFQKRNTLLVDGLAGPQTFNALNESSSYKLKMLQESKKVWDAIPAHSGKKVIVNIPAFEVWTFENDVFQFKMKCVVGRTSRKTVSFSNLIRYVDIRPYWNIPYSIFKRDKLPKILKYGPSYLTSHHYEVVGSTSIIDPHSLDWGKYKHNRFPYRLRQKPGDWNALGLVKYIFPNRHAIYMHDTPSKHLFDLDRRAYSSGCVRLHEPAKMGAFLLDKTEDEITAAMHDESSPHTIVRLQKNNYVPVHIRYMPAWVEQNGEAKSAPDIYNKF